MPSNKTHLTAVQPGQAAIAVADFQHALARQAPGKAKQRGGFVSFRVESESHEFIPELELQLVNCHSPQCSIHELE